MMDALQPANRLGHLPLPMAGLLAGLAYLAGALLGLSFVDHHASPIWPASGIALAALALFGRRVAPVLWLAALGVNRYLGADWLPAGLLASGSLAEYLLAQTMLQHFGEDSLRVERIRDVASLALVSLASAAVAALTAVTTLGMSGIVTVESLRTTFITWWLGDAVALYLVAPLIVTWWERRAAGVPVTKVVVSALLAAAVSLLVFSPGSTLPLAFLVMPVVVWAGIHCGIRGALVVVLGVAVPAIWETTHGQGVFASSGHQASLLLLQAFIVVVTATAYTVAAAVAERGAAFQKLQRAASVFESSREGIMITDARFRVLEVNPAFERITGFAQAEVVGRSTAFLASGRHEAGFFFAMRDTLRTEGKWFGEVWQRRADGEIHPVLLAINAVADPGEGSIQYVTVMTDLTEQRQHELELSRAGYFDRLTGLPNRELFEDRLKADQIHSERRGTPVAVCLLDLDGFKEINDRLGHAAGDALLIEVANRLRQAVRPDDTVARIGGDEFVVALGDLADADHCMLVLDRIVQAIARPVALEGKEVVISTSIGYTIFPDDRTDADGLLRHADQAMHRAKESGKNRYCLYDIERDRRNQSQRDMMARIRLGLESGEFRLFYQPKVDMQKRAVIGVEALIRWQHPELGMQSPQMFLPLIEGTELDIPTGEWVIREAFRQAGEWKQRGLRLPISVNISTLQFQHGGLPDFLAARLAGSPDVGAESIELEILESISTADVDQVAAVIEACKAQGFHTALDDFGTGQSSLTHLRRLPTDAVKIDQSFVRDMLADANDLAIVIGTIGLAKAFDRVAIAEGVETIEHGIALRGLGCTVLQGYGIAKPMPEARLLEWLEAWSFPEDWR